MTYRLVHITLRDVPPEKYTALIQQIAELGLYGRAGVVVKEAERCES